MRSVGLESDIHHIEHDIDGREDRSPPRTGKQQTDRVQAVAFDDERAGIATLAQR